MQSAATHENLDQAGLLGEASVRLSDSVRIAFVEAGWHKEIVSQARESFLAAIGRYGVDTGRVDVFPVPGAFEIPLHAQQLAKSGRYAGVVACAFVVNGGIYRHDFVASTVVSALMDVQLATGVPVFSVVLTPHHFHEHDEHAGFFTKHFRVKGAEAAVACAATIQSLRTIPGCS